MKVFIISSKRVTKSEPKKTKEREPKGNHKGAKSDPRGDQNAYYPEREIVIHLRLERVSHSNKKTHSGPRAKTHHIQVDLLAMFLAVAICAINFIHLARS